MLDSLKSLGMVHASSFIYCVDDGSKDRTWEIIQALHNSTPIIKGLKLSKNAGHQNAVMAGMLGVKDRADCAITIDADLQDDVSVMNDMIQKYQDGGNYLEFGREKQHTFLKNRAALFYKLMALMD
jgi:glycosyltransferase involved in cell wall biosynthesis